MDYLRFTEILAEEVSAEDEWIQPETLLVEELGMQSIDVVQIVDRIEQELKIELGSVDLSGVETVEQLFRVLL